jgi:hypothetical protein
MNQSFTLPADPLDLEIEPGIPVRSLKTRAECDAALMRIENDAARIRAQIARAEEDPDGVRPGWRTRAQGAMRWKKLTAKAIRAHAIALATPKRAPIEERRKVLLAIIHDEIGATEFDRIVALAAERRPDVFGEPGRES